MKRNHRELDELIDEITVDAYGEEEQMGAFLQALEDNVSFPCTATVIGVPIQITKFDYDGNDRRGLTAKCRRADGTSHIVGVADLVIASDSPCEKYLAAYCKWMGVEPRSPVHALARARQNGQPKHRRKSRLSRLLLATIKSNSRFSP